MKTIIVLGDENSRRTFINKLKDDFGLKDEDLSGYGSISTIGVGFVLLKISGESFYDEEVTLKLISSAERFKSNISIFIKEAAAYLYLEKYPAHFDTDSFSKDIPAYDFEAANSLISKLSTIIEDLIRYEKSAKSTTAKLKTTEADKKPGGILGFFSRQPKAKAKEEKEKEKEVELDDRRLTKKGMHKRPE